MVRTRGFEEVAIVILDAGFCDVFIHVVDEHGVAHYGGLAPQCVRFGEKKAMGDDFDWTCTQKEVAEKINK